MDLLKKKKITTHARAFYKEHQRHVCRYAISVSKINKSCRSSNQLEDTFFHRRRGPELRIRLRE